jgi:ribonuclease P protein subunit RPR2
VLRESWALYQLARQDALTGLLNHREFHTSIAAEVASGTGFTVVVFDLDGFKAVNDTHGHAAGDRVLRRVADAMRQSARTSDVVCRVGGDELAFVLPEGSAADGEAVGARVRARVLALDAEVDVSFGVAEWPADGPTKEMLLLRADVALYAAKSRRSMPRAPDPDPAATAARPSEGDDPERDRAQLRAYARDVRTSYTREIRRSQELKESYLATVRTLSAAFEAKEDNTGGHIHRVHELGLLLARNVLPDEADDPQLTYGFLLHDIGKLAVPDAVLTKPGRLTAGEWALMHGHPEAGHRMLAGIPFLGNALDVVLHHHERWDGRGYPHGLSGQQIPMWARIFAVVDSVDAIVSEHPYRPGRPLGEAVGEVLAGAGSQFDPGCAAAFAELDPCDVEAALQHGGGVYPRRITGAASASAGTERSEDGRPRR